MNGQSRPRPTRGVLLAVLALALVAFVVGLVPAANTVQAQPNVTAVSIQAQPASIVKAEDVPAPVTQSGEVSASEMHYKSALGYRVRAVGGGSFFVGARISSSGDKFYCVDSLLLLNTLGTAKYVTQSTRLSDANFKRVSYALLVFPVTSKDKAVAMNIFISKLATVATSLDKHTSTYLKQMKSQGANVKAIKADVKKLLSLAPPTAPATIRITRFDHNVGINATQGVLTAQVLRGGKPVAGLPVTAVMSGMGRLSSAATVRSNASGLANFTFKVVGPGDVGATVKTVGGIYRLKVVKAKNRQYMIGKAAPKPVLVQTSAKYNVKANGSAKYDCAENCHGVDAPAVLAACNYFAGTWVYSAVVKNSAGTVLQTVKLALPSGKCGQTNFTVDTGNIVGPLVGCSAYKIGGKQICVTLQKPFKVVCGSWPVVGFCLNGDCDSSNLPTWSVAGDDKIMPGTEAMITVGGQTYAKPVKPNSSQTFTINQPVGHGTVIKTAVKVPQGGKMVVHEVMSVTVN